jgi:hypothetical protein
VIIFVLVSSVIIFAVICIKKMFVEEHEEFKTIKKRRNNVTASWGTVNEPLIDEATRLVNQSQSRQLLFTGERELP